MSGFDLGEVHVNIFLEALFFLGDVDTGNKTIV